MADGKALMIVNALKNRGKISVLITDSGLGGLSIFADLANNLKEHKCVKEATLTYFNAWPEQSKGYNLLQDAAERIRVFNNALQSMESFKPDIIAIACNTLSALYPETEFSPRTKIPVIDIISYGVEMIYSELCAQRDSQVIIFGTPITINSNVHKAKLMEKGVAEDRIILQPCDRLAGEIEKDPEGDAVREAIRKFVSEAAAKVKDGKKPILAALCCTHYGYSRHLFKNRLEENFKTGVCILNPNDAMSAGLFMNKEKKLSETVLRLEVFSRIVLSDEKISSISRVLETRSKETAMALRNYRHDPKLFLT